MKNLRTILAEEGFVKSKTAAFDLESELGKIVSKASEPLQEARKRARAELKNTGRIEAALERELEKRGIETIEIQISYHQEYDLANWYLDAKFLVPPELDDEEAEEVFETVIENNHGLDFTTGKYTRKAPRKWEISNTKLFWASALF
jgi:hypothetical protein